MTSKIATAARLNEIADELPQPHERDAQQALAELRTELRDIAASLSTKD